MGRFGDPFLAERVSSTRLIRRMAGGRIAWARRGGAGLGAGACRSQIQMANYPEVIGGDSWSCLGIQGSIFGFLNRDLYP